MKVEDLEGKRERCKTIVMMNSGKEMNGMEEQEQEENEEEEESDTLQYSNHRMNSGEDMNEKTRKKK